MVYVRFNVAHLEVTVVGILSPPRNDDAAVNMGVWKPPVSASFDALLIKKSRSWWTELVDHETRVLFVAEDFDTTCNVLRLHRVMKAEKPSRKLWK